MTLLRLRPYRLLKATGNLRAQAIPLADVQHARSKTADLNQCVQNFLHVNDAQLCLVEVLGPNGERPSRYMPQGSRAERVAENAKALTWERIVGRTVREGQQAETVDVFEIPSGPVDGPDGAA